MWNALKGVALAVVNAVALACAIALTLGRPYSPGLAGPIFVLALFSSVPLGALIGLIAGRLRENRLIMLELVALALIPICGIATMREMGVRAPGEALASLVVVASSPTVFAVIVLERWTRPRPAAPRALRLCA
jgi:hypothetical protein